ncbi:MAG TPA: hypothetical protein VL178_15615 [Pseudomonas sp.]|jgi:hypothetical protein|nr:hypothetical protein [Pseudomonas sp.]
MTALRTNEALLIACRAFQPLQCIAWATDYSGELSLTVIDRTTASVVGRSRMSRTDYADTEHLGNALSEARQHLTAEGVTLGPWHIAE